MRWLIAMTSLSNVMFDTKVDYKRLGRREAVYAELGEWALSLFKDEVVVRRVRHTYSEEISELDSGKV